MGADDTPGGEQSVGSGEEEEGRRAGEGRGGGRAASRRQAKPVDEDAGALDWDKSNLDKKSTLAGAVGKAPISTFPKDGGQESSGSGVGDDGESEARGGGMRGPASRGAYSDFAGGHAFSDLG